MARRAARGLRGWILSIALAFGVFGASACAQEEAGEPLPVLIGVVTAITDGDTLKVRLDSGEVRVRLHGVDAPESNQAYGQHAKELLSDLAFDREVELEVVDQSDRYDRMIAVVFVGELELNTELVTRGAAWAYRAY